MKTTFERLLRGLWLIVCTLLLFAFSGLLRQQILRPKSVQWIDSWEDLHQWKDLKIQTNYISEIKAFTESFPNDPISKDFTKRFLPNEQDDSRTWNFDKAGLINGQVAIVYPYIVEQIIKNDLILDGLQEDIDFHISIPMTNHLFTFL